MADDDIRGAALRPGLVWGFDFVDGRSRAVYDTDLLTPDVLPAAGFRWLHFNLADQRTVRWLGATDAVPPRLKELFFSPDEAQRFVIDQDRLGLVLHDIEFEFHDESEPRVGVFRIALCPRLIVTGRHHPLRSAEALKQRLDAGACVTDAASALDLIFGSMTDVFRGVTDDLDATVQAVEDELLKDRPSPDAKAFINMRSLMVRLHRVYVGMRNVFNRLEDEGGEDLPFAGPASRFLGRLSNLDSELLAIQSQLRLLRDELDLQATQQTNQNLYFLSVLTALLMPATLVTGIFGMNTSGLLWTTGQYGSLWATGLALGSAGVVYLVLRLTGFIRR